MTLPRPGVGVPFDQPLYGASFRQAVGRFLRKYATFTGRASRSEFWWAQLFTNVVALVATLPLLVTLMGQVVATVGFAMTAGSSSSTSMPIDVIGWMLGSVVAMLPLFAVSFGLMVPAYALGARRLHDAGLSGWFMALAPVTGGALVIVVGLLPPRLEGLQFEQPGSVPVLAPDVAADVF